MITNGAGVFRLVKPESVEVRVEVEPPDGRAPGTMTLKVRYLAMSGRKALLERLSKERVTDAALAQELVAGWQGVADEDGEPISFSQDALAAAMDIPYVHDAVRDALIRELFGRGWKKNSLTPDGDGPLANGA